MCVNVYVSMRVWMCVHVCVCDVCMSVYGYVCISVSVNVCMCLLVFVCRCVCV